ncbi:MAG: metal-dependent hydrolase [Rubrivivax sp.]|nr:metal-dependent hydrolase [Rubrivivax sp.]
MDLLTHALLGATLAQATAPAQPGPLPPRHRLMLGAAGAAFPDIDFAGFLVDPLTFLADWHQGPTHSLPWLPLWAGLIAAMYVTRHGAAAAGRGGAGSDARGRAGEGAGASGSARARVFAAAAWVAGLGIASHIAADVVTAYGTMVLHPLSRWRASLGTTFVIDPLFTLLVAAGLAVRAGDGRWPARAALAVLAGYVAAQAGLRQQALDLARATAPAGTVVSAWPQPFSPFNWKLVARGDGVHHVAHVNLAGHAPLVPAWPGLRWLHASAAAYRPPGRLAWQPRPLHGGPSGEHADLQATIERLWADPRFAAFRRLATHPALSAVQHDAAATCVWFTDLRYDLPALPDTFRYGFCRESTDAPWQLHRLRYFTAAQRQRIG